MLLRSDKARSHTSKSIAIFTKKTAIETSLLKCIPSMSFSVSPMDYCAFRIPKQALYKAFKNISLTVVDSGGGVDQNIIIDTVPLISRCNLIDQQNGVHTGYDGISVISLQTAMRARKLLVNYFKIC